jgi:hypothetical protein
MKIVNVFHIPPAELIIRGSALKVVKVLKAIPVTGREGP